MSSPFLLVPPSDWIASNPLAFAIRDKYPVTPGHTLVILKCEVATWWEATADERAAIWELVDEVRRGLDGGRGDGEGVEVGELSAASSAAGRRRRRIHHAHSC